LTKLGSEGLAYIGSEEEKLTGRVAPIFLLSEWPLTEDESVPIETEVVENRSAVSYATDPQQPFHVTPCVTYSLRE
jgi:hypothetical protein